MSEGGVLHRLLAERYNVQKNNKRDKNKDSKNQGTVAKNKNDDITECKDNKVVNRKVNKFVKSKSLESPEPSRNVNTSNLQITTNTYFDKLSHKPLTLIPRLRQEFLTKEQNSSLNDSEAILDQSARPCVGDNYSTQINYPSNTIRLNSLPEANQFLYGHPKSNSGGDEFLYTDRQSKVTRSAVARRRHNSRGKTAAVVRSRSMHAATSVSRPERYQQKIIPTDLSRMRSAGGSETQLHRNTSDCSSKSSGSISREIQQANSCHSVSGSGESYFQITNLVTNQVASQQTASSAVQPVSDATNKSLNSGGYITASEASAISSHLRTDLQASGMDLPPTTQQAVLTPVGMHGTYYTQMPTQQLNQGLNTSHANASNATSPPRGPPPPYPMSSSSSSTMMTIDAPQRPNSLALGGQSSRKKNNGNGPSAPALTSPIMKTNYVNPFSMTEGTPVRGTPFYSFPQEVSSQQLPAVTAANSALQNSFQMPTSSSHQFHHMNKQPEQLIRSDSIGRTVIHHQHPHRNEVQNYPTSTMNKKSPNSTTMLSNSALSSQSSSSSSTAVGTPVSYAHPPTYPSEREMQGSYNQHVTPPSASPAYTPNYHSVGQGKAVQEYITMPYSNNGNYTLGKSDSINSSTSNSSTGSRIARRAKRNSRNFASNTSGSSSGTGSSRPNSSADLMESLMSENESLRSQLTTFEKNLSRVTDELLGLNKSAQKREMLDVEMRKSLESENLRLRQQNNNLEERVKTLSELVSALQNSEQQNNSTVNAKEVMEYKEKYQRLALDHKVLEEDLTEKKDELSELKADYELLLQSLKKKQDKNTQSQNNRKHSTEMEQLLPILQMLEKTVRDRQKVEQELAETLRYNLQQQRNSTSSNDEGISEMEISIATVSDQQFPILPTQKNEKLLRTKSGMLKLQQMYLFDQLENSCDEYRDVLAPVVERLNVSDSNGDYNAIGAMLHRHTISDPSFNKLQFAKLDQSLRHLTEDDESVLKENNTGASERSPRRRRKHQANTSKQNNNHFYHCKETKTPSKLSVKPLPEKNTGPSPKSPSTDDFNVNYSNIDHNCTRCNSEAVASNEFDSPSEGYHSQQSSGSPTPSSERSSMHFAEGDPRITSLPDSNSSCRPTFATNTQQKNQFNRRKSVETLDV